MIGESPQNLWVWNFKKKVLLKKKEVENILKHFEYNKAFNTNGLLYFLSYMTNDFGVKGQVSFFRIILNTRVTI